MELLANLTLYAVYSVVPYPEFNLSLSRSTNLSKRCYQWQKSNGVQCLVGDALCVRPQIGANVCARARVLLLPEVNSEADDRKRLYQSRRNEEDSPAELVHDEDSDEGCDHLDHTDQGSLWALRYFHISTGKVGDKMSAEMNIQENGMTIKGNSCKGFC